MRTFLYIFIIAVLTMVGCGRRTPEQGIDHNEIRALNAQVLETAISQPDSALMMIDSLRVNGLLADYRCDYLRAKVYAQTLEGECLDSAIIIGERLMALDAVNQDLALRQDVLEVLIDASRQHQHDKLTIHWCMELIDLCRQQGFETEALRNEAEMGLMLSDIGHTEEGLAKIDSVINQLNGKRKFNELDASIIALKRKITVLNNVQCSNAQLPDVQPDCASRIVHCALQILDLLADYDQNPGEYHDDTYREPPEHLRPGYIDFYRAQAYMFLANAYAKAPLSSFEGGTIDETSKGKTIEAPSGAVGGASYYLSLFEQTDYAKTYSGRKIIAPTYGLLGQYDKMLAIHAEEEARLREQGDTVNEEYATILRDRAMAAEAQGRKDEALSLRKANETLTATLADRQLQGKANLYAARFLANEQQREIERKDAEASRNALIAWLVAVVAVLLASFAVYYYLRQRKEARKNRVLAREITEAIEYKEKFIALSEKVRVSDKGKVNSDKFATADLSEKERANSDVSATAEGSEEAEASLSAVHPSSQEENLFNQIASVIRDEQLYLNPVFDRQAVARRFGISTRQIGTAFAQGSPYKSLPGFIRDLRLEHACRLLATKPDMSIREVGEASGFSNNSTFCSDFVKKFEITPTVYRQMSQQENQ